MKRAIFWAVLLLPALLVAFFAAAFVNDIIKLKRVNQAMIGRTLNAYLEQKDPTTFPPPQAFLELAGDEDAIFVFGASSVVISDDKTFSQYLEKDLSAKNARLKVVNFGIPGIDSYSVRLRVEQALRHARKKPKALLIYYGHNDYNVAYRSVMHEYFGEAFNTFLKTGYYLSRRTFHFPDQKFVFGSEEYNEFYWYGIFTRPEYINLAQRLRMFKVDNEKFREYDKRILEQFAENTQAITDMAQAQGVPVIFITPVCNLRAKPYGAIDIVDKNYRLGLAEKDYRKSIEYLKTAKDNEIFTGDISAKSILRDYLRTLDNSRTVFVLDLEQDLINEGFRFDETNFLDYFHFRDQAHRRIGDYVFEKIDSNRNLREALGLDKK